jgi:retron-type reverse transcriptase/5-methylcytosine-specific restriction endonuclease McrA
VQQQKIIKKKSNLGNVRKTKKESFKFKNYKIQELREHVLNSQINIAMELRKGNFELVKKQIKALTRSDKARAYAVYLTIKKKGFRSPGLSKRKPKTNKEYNQLIKQLWLIVKKPQNYKASPLSRKMVPKPNGGERPISVPTYIDRALQTLYKFVLEVFQEETADLNSFGFRPYRSPGWAVKATTLAIWSRKTWGPPCYAVEFDIAKCFDTISHEFIMNEVGNFQYKSQRFQLIPNEILEQWLKCGFVYTDRSPDQPVLPTTGVPQGGPISPVISNMVFNGLENFIKEYIQLNTEQMKPLENKLNRRGGSNIKLTPIEFSYNDKPLFCSLKGATNSDIAKSMEQLSFAPAKQRKIPYQITDGNTRSLYGWSCTPIEKNLLNKEAQKLSNKQNWCYIARFADDVTFLCYNENIIKLGFEAMTKFLDPRGMKLNTEKSVVKDLKKEGFNMLGYTIHCKKGKVAPKALCLPNPKKLEKFLQKVKILLNENKNLENCFLKLNSVLRGFCNYYSTGNSSKTFSTLNYRLWHMVYKMFWKKYSFYKTFKKGSQKLDKKKLSKYIWTNHLRPYKYYSKWWFVKRSSKSKRYKDPFIYLYAPQTTKVATPAIILKRMDQPNLSLSAFHPDDRLILEEKAIGWRKGLDQKLLAKAGGRCQACDCSLVSGETNYERHHIKPVSLSGSFTLKNLAVLCRECHRDITNAVSTNNLSLIKKYETKSLLEGLSSAQNN